MIPESIFKFQEVGRSRLRKQRSDRMSSFCLYILYAAVSLKHDLEIKPDECSAQKVSISAPVL